MPAAQVEIRKIITTREVILSELKVADPQIVRHVGVNLQLRTNDPVNRTVQIPLLATVKDRGNEWFYVHQWAPARPLGKNCILVGEDQLGQCANAGS